MAAAFKTSRSVTAAFNREVLHVIYHDLDADFDADGFDHVAFFDADHEWIEMRLWAHGRQIVRIARSV